MSLVSELSLTEYIAARKEHCCCAHLQPCSKCQRLLQVGSTVLEEGYCLLSSAFRKAFPNMKYRTEPARRLLLQMPLVAVRIGNHSLGNSYTVLLENQQGVNYARMSVVLEGLATTVVKTPVGIDKKCVKVLLALARSDRERECLRYAVFKASGISQTEARRRFGFENMTNRAANVEQVLQETEKIREAIDDLAKIQDKAVLESIGVAHITQDSSEDSESDVDTDEYQQEESSVTTVIPEDVLKKTLESSHFNWFECISQLESLFSP